LAALYFNLAASGLLTGLIYALIAVGLNIIFGVMRIVNFAHGEMVVLGMYLGYWLWLYTGLPPWSTMPVAALALFLAGYGLQRGFINSFVDRSHHAQFIVFIAFALIITGCHLILFGPDLHSIRSPASFQVYRLGPLNLDAVRAQAAGGAVAIMAILFAFLERTNLGHAIKAAADNLVGAQVIGIDIRKVYAVTAGIGMACAGASGALLAPIIDTNPFLASQFTGIAFSVVIIGGLGSLPGALIGGVLLGLVESLAALAVAPSLKFMFSSGLLVLVLLLRPQGLLGAKDRHA
jgi:branched-chain amino acid transport system permease protein